MKRFFAALLCALMIVSLAACSGNSTPTNTPAANEPDTVQTATTPNITNSHLFGEYYGNSYCNTAMNIGISFHNEWTLTSTAALAKANGMEEQDMLTNFNTLMADVQTAYILNASDPTGESTASIMLENLKMTGHENVTGAEYIEVSEEPLKTALQNDGASNIIITASSVQIAGKGYSVRLLSYMTEDGSVYQEQILFPLGNYMAILTLTGDTSEVINRIYSLE